MEQFERVPILLELQHSLVFYIASDGKKFTDKTAYLIHERKLIRLRVQWFLKRFSTWNMFRHWLTGYEPPKPYNF